MKKRAGIMPARSAARFPSALRGGHEPVQNDGQLGPRRVAQRAEGILTGAGDKPGAHCVLHAVHRPLGNLVPVGVEAEYPLGQRAPFIVGIAAEEEGELFPGHLIAGAKASVVVAVGDADLLRPAGGLVAPGALLHVGEALNAGRLGTALHPPQDGDPGPGKHIV